LSLVGLQHHLNVAELFKLSLYFYKVYASVSGATYGQNTCVHIHADLLSDLFAFYFLLCLRSVSFSKWRGGRCC